MGAINGVHNDGKIIVLTQADEFWVGINYCIASLFILEVKFALTKFAFVYFALLIIGKLFFAHLCLTRVCRVMDLIYAVIATRQCMRSWVCNTKHRRLTRLQRCTEHQRTCVHLPCGVFNTPPSCDTLGTMQPSQITHKHSIHSFISCDCSTFPYLLLSFFSILCRFSLIKKRI